MDALTTLDILVLILVIGLALLGAVRGFVTEILSLLAWVAAVIALRLFFAPGAVIGHNIIGSEVGGAIIAFAFIFFTVFIAFRMIGKSLGDRTKQSIVGPIDRLLGFGFGAVKGVLLASLGFAILMLGHRVLWGEDEALPKWVLEAKAAPLLDLTGRALIDYAKTKGAGGGVLGSSDEQNEPQEDGYSDDVRDALDALLEETGGTEI